MPVLDGNIDDGLSDARSLAASMRGGGVDELYDAHSLAASMRGGGELCVEKPSGTFRARRIQNRWSVNYSVLRRNKGVLLNTF